MRDAEYAILKSALAMEFCADWGADGPCQYTEVPPPESGCYVQAPSGMAVQFTVLGRHFVDFGRPDRAEHIADYLAAEGVYTQPRTPTMDRQTVRAVIRPAKKGTIMRFAFVSRHVPTQGQIALASEHGITLEHVGDRDAFAFPAEEIVSRGFTGVAVVHPMAALTAYRAGLSVGVFNNVNRAPVGAPPNFETTQFVVISPRDPSFHCPTCANACGEHCR